MDAIQKTLVKAGRKDLAQKYYQKVSQRTQTNQLKVDELIESAGGVKSEDFKNGLGKVFGMFSFYETNRAISEFYDKNHAFWSRDVGAFSKDGQMYLVDFRGTVLKINLTAQEVKL